MANACSNCSAELGPLDKFCGVCGTKTLIAAAPHERSNLTRPTEPSIYSIYLTPNGRLAPGQFLKHYLISTLAAVAVLMLIVAFDPNWGLDSGPFLAGLLAASSNSIGAVLFLLILPITYWVSWCLTVKRFHDFGMAMLVPTLVVIASLVPEFYYTELVDYLSLAQYVALTVALCVLPGNPSENEYWPPPAG